MTMKAVGEADVQPVVEIATTSSPANPDAVYRRTSAQAAWTLLMIGLSITAALNFALLRHLQGFMPNPGPGIWAQPRCRDQSPPDHTNLSA